jgi:hypothetical protein
MTLQVMALLCQWMFLLFIVIATLSLVAAAQLVEDGGFIKVQRFDGNRSAGTG